MLIAHLIQRHVDPIDIEALSGIYCSEDAATFMLYNEMGQITGYIQYRPNGSKDITNDKLRCKYYFRHRGGHPYYGIHSLKNPGPLLLCEGLFDAMRLHSYGFAAIAVLSNNPKPLHNQIRLWSTNRQVIAVCDGDSGGKALAKYADSAIYLPDGEDPASCDANLLLKEIDNERQRKSA